MRLRMAWIDPPIPQIVKDKALEGIRMAANGGFCHSAIVGDFWALPK